MAESVGGDVTREKREARVAVEKQTLTMTKEGAKDESKLEGQKRDKSIQLDKGW